MSLPKDPYCLTAWLKSLKISSLPERHLDREADLFVTVSVDGQQQGQTQPATNPRNPKWEFDEPYMLMVYPSSTLSFSLYRHRWSSGVLGDKPLGRVDEKLTEILAKNSTDMASMTLEVKTSRVHHHTVAAQLSVELVIDYTRDPEALLDIAEDRLEQEKLDTSAGPLKNGAIALGDAIENLDHLVSFVDGIMDVHPICKTAWMLLSFVYKAFKKQTAQATAIQQLSQDLSDTLAYAKNCKNIRSIPDGIGIIRDLVHLVVDCAALMDESMHGARIVRVAKSVVTETIAKRTSSCAEQLKRQRFRLQAALNANLHNDFAELKADIKDIQHKVSAPAVLNMISSSKSRLTSPIPSPPLSAPSAPTSFLDRTPRFPTPRLPPPPPPSTMPYSPGLTGALPTLPYTSYPPFPYSNPSFPLAPPARPTLPMPDVGDHYGRIMPDAPYVSEPDGIVYTVGGASKDYVRDTVQAREATHHFLWDS